MVSDTALQEFKEIWRKEFGEEIPNDVAIEEAANLLVMFDAVYRPLQKTDIDEYNKRYL